MKKSKLNCILLLAMMFTCGFYYQGSLLQRTINSFFVSGDRIFGDFEDVEIILYTYGKDEKLQLDTFATTLKEDLPIILKDSNDYKEMRTVKGSYNFSHLTGLLFYNKHNLKAKGDSLVYNFSLKYDDVNFPSGKLVLISYIVNQGEIVSIPVMRLIDPEQVGREHVSQVLKTIIRDHYEQTKSLSIH